LIDELPEVSPTLAAAPLARPLPAVGRLRLADGAGLP